MLKEELLINIQIVFDLIPKFVQAGGLTLRLGLIGALGAMLTGFLLFLIRYYKVPFLSAFSAAYFELSRNTPLIVQLFFLYYALPKLGVSLSGELCAILGLTFLGGSYSLASIESGVEGISKNQIQAAKALGFNRFEILKLFILPIGLKNSISGLFANLIFFIKETSVFSIIAVMDLMSLAKSVIGISYQTTESLFLLTVSYFIILAPFVVVYYYIQKKFVKQIGKTNESF